MSKAWYALRRTLPPWSADENLAELLIFCRENFVDEVIVKVDVEEFSHGIPSVQWLEDYLPVLHKTKKELDSIGVVFSINPWVTQVHCDRGRFIKQTYPDIDLMVGHDGVQCTACSCPLSEGWQSATRELWHRYASIHPSVLWVEDDIRLLNHQPIEYGCFCSLHMREFSKKVGKEVSREDLVTALLAPGEPNPYRKMWLDLNRDIMNDTVLFLEGCTHEVSPETKLGLMCSPPNGHAIEGRDWDSFTKALAGDQTLVARPCLCEYSENSPRGLYNSAYFLRSIMHCLPKGAIIQTEVENWPFTGYAKSMKFTFLQCALSFIFGADGVTMNLFDHLGTPMSITPEVGEMLRESKGFFNALAQSCHGGKQQGIGLLHAQDGSYFVETGENANYMELSPGGESWRQVLEPLGFPITYEQSKITALSGQVIRSKSEQEIKELLSGAVLLDWVSIKCLIDMGYSDLLGITINRVIRKFDQAIAAEECFNTDFGGWKHKYLTHTLSGLAGDPEVLDFQPHKDAIVLSRLVDPDTNPVYPFVTLFENNMGGRVAIYPVDIDYAAQGAAFLHPYRKQQISVVLNWLSKGNVALEVFGGEYSLPFRLDFDERIIVGTFNLTLDNWKSVTFDLQTDQKLSGDVERLYMDGSWHKEKTAKVTKTPNGIRVNLQQPLEPTSLVVLLLK